MISPRVSSRTGVNIYHKEALRLLGKAGCRIVADRVYYPPRLVEECIQSAPSLVAVFNREGEQTMVLSEANVYSTFSLLMNALAGANLIHDVGYLSSGKTGSCEMILFSDEVIGMVKRVLRGIPVDRNVLATDAIDRVGPGGHFLTDEHTLAQMRSEYRRPNLLNRDNLDVWKAKGELPLQERVHRRVIEVLETHTPKALSENVHKEMNRIIEKAKTSTGTH